MYKNGRLRIFNFLLGAVLLSTGGLIYLLFRSRYVLLNRIVLSTDLETVVDEWRCRATIINVPEWVIYSLPGGLWAISYIFIIDSLMRHRCYQCRMLWACPIPLLGLVSEIMQCLGILPGTFDLIDLLFYITPLFLYSLFINKQLLSWKESR